MTAIETMVALLEEKKKSGPISYAIDWALDEARRLASEEAKDTRKKEAELGLILSLPLEAKEKPTAPVCPICGMGIKLTERRIDGNSVCFNGHTSKTKDCYRPQTDIAGEIRRYCFTSKEITTKGQEDIKEIISKHTKEGGV